MILHAKTKDVTADFICSSKEAREDLTNILVKIAEKMALLGVTTGLSDGGTEAMASARQIRKLKRKAKALKKKQECSGSQMQPDKPNKPAQDPSNYLSKETIEAIKRAAGIQGNIILAHKK